ncbi:cytochrome c family protein [Myxococcota bacterium]|nr:cytochrome c family protein [Myxococcota bacterium]
MPSASPRSPNLAGAASHDRITSRRWVSLLFALTLLGPARAALAGDGDCLQCHERDKYSAQGVSKHQVVPCNGCHAPYVDVCSKGQVAQPVKGTLTASIAVKAPKAPSAAAECKTCHVEQFAEWTKSIHAKALLTEGKADGAYCMDCHGPAHQIGRKLAEDPVKQHLAQIESCMKCHGDPEITKDHDLNAYVAETYRDSIHLKTVALGDLSAPTCHDCHGAHDIRKKEDPSSLVSTAKVVETCNKCHPGSTPAFATTYSHRPFTKDGIVVGYWITQFFTWVTFVTMGLLVIHATLDAVKLLRSRKEGHGSGHGDGSGQGQDQKGHA